MLRTTDGQAVKYLLIHVLTGCSATVAISNPTCVIMCQNSGDITTNKKLKED